MIPWSLDSDYAYSNEVGLAMKSPYAPLIFQRERDSVHVYRSRGDGKIGRIIKRDGRYAFSAWDGVELTCIELEQIAAWLAAKT
jgi:hypothetical protein